MEALTPGHLVIILIAVVLLAGYRKLPDAARSIGRSLRIFRGELRAADDEAPRGSDQPSATLPTASATTPAPAPSAASAPSLPPASAEQFDREAAEAEALAARLRDRAALAQDAPPTAAG